jgi:hypothetical protein
VRNDDQPGHEYHPDHDRYLHHLGIATWEAARLATYCVDILRVWHDVDSSAIYDDPLGTLETRLRGLLKAKPHLPRLAEFLDALGPARLTRNDLLHALAVHNGLHRRRTKDLQYVRNFYTPEDLDEAANEMIAATRIGAEVLYSDGGAAVTRWYNAEWSKSRHCGQATA